MRINLTKKDLINQIYMQLGFSKLVTENLINDFLSTVILNLKEEKKLKLSRFGTFSIRRKKSRVGRNPKTRELKLFRVETLSYLNLQKNLRNLLIIKMTDKSENAYKTIGEVAKILELKSKNKGVFSTHTIRFWETQFKQVKPKLLNSNRRYYDQKTINILKKIKFLLKDQGMTINGVKKILDNPNNNDTLNLDEISNNSIRTNNFKNKVLKISKIVKNLKNYK